MSDSPSSPHFTRTTHRPINHTTTVSTDLYAENPLPPISFFKNINPEFVDEEGRKYYGAEVDVFRGFNDAWYTKVTEDDMFNTETDRVLYVIPPKNRRRLQHVFPPVNEDDLMEFTYWNTGDKWEGCVVRNCFRGDQVTYASRKTGCVVVRNLRPVEDESEDDE